MNQENDQAMNPGNDSKPSGDSKFYIGFKLSGKKNYPVWVFTMEAMLQKYKLWDMVSGHQEKVGATDQEKVDTMVALTRNMEQGQICEIIDFRKLPWGAWNKLKRLHQGVGADAEATISGHLAILLAELPGSLTHEVMKEYFDRIRELNRRLQALGDDGYQSPTQLGMNIIAKLKTLDEKTYPRWVTMGDNLASKAKPERTFDAVEEMVLNALGGGNRIDNMSKIGATALTTSKGEFKYQCWHCDQVGHRKMDCPQLNNRNGGNGGGGSRSSKKKKNRSQAQQRANVTVALVTRALTATSNGGVKSGRRDFVLDGATQTGHLVKHKDLFVEGTYQEVKGGCSIAGFSDVKTKDASLPKVVGKGSVKLILPNGDQVLLKNVRYVPEGSVNLFSVRTALLQLQKAGDADAKYEVKTRSSKIVLGNGKTLLSASESGGLFYLDLASDQDF